MSKSSHSEAAFTESYTITINQVLLCSLFNQTVKPEVAVVDDDSSINDIIEKVLSLDARGLNELKKFNLDLCMISGAEFIYPKTYVERVVKRIRASGVAIASEKPLQV